MASDQVLSILSKMRHHIFSFNNTYQPKPSSSCRCWQPVPSCLTTAGDFSRNAGETSVTSEARFFTVLNKDIRRMIYDLLGPTHETVFIQYNAPVLRWSSNGLFRLMTTCRYALEEIGSLLLQNTVFSMPPDGVLGLSLVQGFFNRDNIQYLRIDFKGVALRRIPISADTTDITLYSPSAFESSESFFPPSESSLDATVRHSLEAFPNLQRLELATPFGILPAIESLIPHDLRSSASSECPKWVVNKAALTQFTHLVKSTRKKDFHRVGSWALNMFTQAPRDYQIFQIINLLDGSQKLKGERILSRFMSQHPVGVWGSSALLINILACIDAVQEFKDHVLSLPRLSAVDGLQPQGPKQLPQVVMLMDVYNRIGIGHADIADAKAGVTHPPPTKYTIHIDVGAQSFAWRQREDVYHFDEAFRAVLQLARAALSDKDGEENDNDDRGDDRDDDRGDDRDDDRDDDTDDDSDDD